MQITEQGNRITHIAATLSGVSIIRARSRYSGTVGSIHNQPVEPSGLSPEEYEIRRSVIEAKDRWKQVEIEAQCRGWPKASVLKLVSDILGVHVRNRVVHTKYNHSAIAQRLLDGASVKEIRECKEAELRELAGQKKPEQDTVPEQAEKPQKPKKE